MMSMPVTSVNLNLALAFAILSKNVFIKIGQYI
jgi:hypothetical protein